MVTATSSVALPPTTQAIHLREVGFGYVRQDGSLFPVLKDLTLVVPYGQIVGLVGRNGAGKTTLLELLRGGLAPQHGEVQVGRTMVARAGRLMQQPSVAIISQRPDASLAPTMTVYENYAIAAGRNGFRMRWAYSKRRAEACRDLLRRAGMGLEDKCREQTRFLSSGQQQALAVLLALESPDPLLLMDEPTAALDPFAAEGILELAISEARRIGGSIVLVSHRLRDVVERCSRVLVLHDGSISRDIDCSTSRVTEQELLAAMANSVVGPE